MLSTSISDCGTRTISNGQFSASSGTTLGETATQSCNDGYTLEGDETVTCTASGWNGSVATCTIKGTLKIKDLFILAKKWHIAVCLLLKYWLINKKLEKVLFKREEHFLIYVAFLSSDCSVPSIPNGKSAETPKGTTYNEIAIMSCEDGYTLNGNAFVTCQANGNWSTLPTCVIKGKYMLLFWYNRVSYLIPFTAKL